MTVKNNTALTRRENIIDMAVTFTAMTRVFETGSKEKIVKHLKLSFDKLSKISSKNHYEILHADFCSWFTENIMTARGSSPASYGQAAKVFDISVKVYVHYCHLPNCETAIKLLPFLHGAVDTPIMNYLKSRYPDTGLNTKTIKSIGKMEYESLQKMISNHIKEEFDSQIFPAQYDDIMWNFLNRQT